MELPDEFAEAIDEGRDGWFVTNFIIIYEISDGTRREMNTSVSDGMTPWLAEGMVNYGRRALWDLEEFTYNEEDS